MNIFRIGARSACSRRPCAEEARAAGCLKLCLKVRRLAVNGEACCAAWATRAGATDAERSLAGGPGHGHHQTRHCVASDWTHQATAVRAHGDTIGAKGEGCRLGSHAAGPVARICDPSARGPCAPRHAGRCRSVHREGRIGRRCIGCRRIGPWRRVAACRRIQRGVGGRATHEASDHGEASERDERLHV